MKNIIYSEDMIDIINRFKWLREKDTPRWGQINVNEMLCHLSDHIRLALGLKSAEYSGNKFKEKFLIHLILWGIPVPKKDVETVIEMNQGNGRTKPTEFYTDKDALIKLIKKFNADFKENAIVKHPVLGPLNKQQWGRLIYTHLNHHLKQFYR